MIPLQPDTNQSAEGSSGFLLIDKPSGMTSHDVVDRVRRLTGIRQIGHAGTLDPIATGLLILGIGPATKKLSDLVGLDKTYEATLMLGATSDTFDREGHLTPLPPLLRKARGCHTIQTPSPYEGEGRGEVDRVAIDRALAHFLPGYSQLAPLFSAKKLHGKKLYELARAGTATEEMRPVKHVTISRLDVVDFDWPRLKIIVDCSSGTYIRSLADDIGRELGCGAYLDALRRTRIGNYDVSQATPLDKLSDKDIHNQILTVSS